MPTQAPLPTLSVTVAERGDRDERQRLTRRARRLTQLGLAWHALEAAIAIGAGVIACAARRTAAAPRLTSGWAGAFTNL